MLEICNISKQYVLKDQKVDALKGVTMRFRRSEFVAILGPSGCGKTTLLNVIGGLDRYSDGDLIIDGVSTKDFKDKDWDNYRNHRVGFVFQSYNLIPHQSILENVELALTLSGVKRKERRNRAIEVLNKVGLGDKLKSKPNQLSGGQMQRVAIARALVNDPEIILADEPTGALDSKTSVQIMDLLKEVSKDRLVVMVTHNPDLATTYSTRIIRLLDGELIEDSKPYSQKACENEVKRHKQKLLKREEQLKQLLLEEQLAKKQAKQNKKHAVADVGAQTKSKIAKPTFKKTNKKKGMSFFTALFLSFKNLLTKKGRTIMVAFAGSIGIIGIALILSVSAGMTGYINRTQSESLSSYPLAVSAISVDYDKTMDALMSDNTTNDEDDHGFSVYDETTALMQLGKYNYISKEFVDYIQDYYSNPNKKNLINDINISYASSLHLITQQTIVDMVPSLDDPDSQDPSTFVQQPKQPIYVPINDSLSYSVMSGTIESTFFEELDKDYVTSIYDVVGNYPTQSDEVALVVNSKSLTKSFIDSLGIDDVIIKPKDNPLEQYHQPIDFDSIINKKTFNLIYNDGYYNEQGKPILNFGSFNPLNPSTSSSNQSALKNMLNNPDNYKQLTVTAILLKKEGVSGSLFSDGVMYTHALMNEYRANCASSTVVENVKKMLTNEDGSINFEQDFPINYSVDISELAMFGSAYQNKFSYPTPTDMSAGLLSQGITLSDADFLDLYLQMYGASSVPSGVYFYATTFKAKDDVVSMIDNWNDIVKSKQGDETFVGFSIELTDSSAFVSSILSTLVNIISYVLVAFAAISLVVSSIMIGIITYTSVIERTKEIGVLRSVGASKWDVFRVFTAETVIIGLAAGIIGVGVASILSVLVSMLLKNLTGVGGLAIVQPLSCLALVIISVVLTFIAGLIPSRIATKKDPVKALRTE